MKNKKILKAMAAFALTIGCLGVMTVEAENAGIAMYRLYNPNSGEHFYTSDEKEKNTLVELGWMDEGTGWYAPEEGDVVYRLYNPNAGEHHYTMDKNEKDTLVELGWTYEGEGWFSVAQESEDEVTGLAVYRQYNPNAVTGSHNYTLDANENDTLVSWGWYEEGVAWYAVDPDAKEPVKTAEPTAEPAVPTAVPTAEPTASPEATAEAEKTEEKKDTKTVTAKSDADKAEEAEYERKHWKFSVADECWYYYTDDGGKLMQNTVIDGKTILVDSETGAVDVSGDVRRMTLVEAARRMHEGHTTYSQGVLRMADGYYDCSSFVLRTLSSIGVNIGNASYTGDMWTELQKHGFEWRTDFENIEAGDILVEKNVHCSILTDRDTLEIIHAVPGKSNAVVTTTPTYNPAIPGLTSTNVRYLYDGYLHYVGE